MSTTPPLIVEYWRLLMREKYLVLGLALLLAALFVTGVLQMASVYRTSATVLFEGGQRRPVSFDEVYRELASDPGTHLTEAEFLQTRDVALRVIRKLRLTSLPEFDPAADAAAGNPLATIAEQVRRILPGSAGAAPPPKPEDFALARFRERLKVERLSQTQLFRVSFESADPELAAGVANEVVAAYIRADMDARYEATKEANTWLSDRLSQLEVALERSERALQDYRQRNDLLARSSDAATERQLSEIQQRLMDARTRRSALEDSFIQANTKDVNAALTTPGIASNPMVMRAREAELAVEKRLVELRNQLGSAHPQFQAVSSELAAARDTLRNEINGAVRIMARELSAARAAEKQLEAELKSARSAGQSIDTKEIALGQLEREVSINRQLYQTFLARNKEIAAASDFQQPAARLVDPALVPTVPTRPPMALVAVFGAFVGALLGLLIILVKDRIRNTLRTSEEVESRLGETLLAAIPKLRPADVAGAGRHFIREPDSLFAEAIRTAATGIAMVSLDSGSSVVAIGSALDDEGKTTVACNLALALSSSRRVLLIDADLHRPSVGMNLGLDPRRPGLSRLLDGRASVEECLQNVEGTALTVIPAGRIPGNALDLLMGERFRHLIGDLQQRFDLVLLDTPPVQLVADTMVLARVAGGMIMVARSDQTPLPVVRRALRRVKGTGIVVLGVVLNAHDFKRADRYYGENSGYKDLGYRYGYKAQGPAKADAGKRSRVRPAAVS